MKVLFKKIKAALWYCWGLVMWVVYHRLTIHERTALMRAQSRGCRMEYVSWDAFGMDYKVYPRRPPQERTFLNFKEFMQTYRAKS